MADIVITREQADRFGPQRVGQAMANLAALAKARTGVDHEWRRVLSRDQIELHPVAPSPSTP